MIKPWRKGIPRKPADGIAGDGFWHCYGLPLPLLIIGAWCRPDVYLLAGQGWMLWHDPQNLPDSLMLRQDQLRFLRVFPEQVQPAEALLRLRVLGDPVVTLNGVVLPAQASRLHWKQSLTYDLQKAWRRVKTPSSLISTARRVMQPCRCSHQPRGVLLKNWKVQRDNEPPLPAMAPGSRRHACRCCQPVDGGSELAVDGVVLAGRLGHCRDTRR
ncbi:MAG: hypothetical protein HC898_00765 [Phycisphaerales bacterium]|nr:hypothetical protein [Phycisphaerales bacterium]